MAKLLHPTTDQLSAFSLGQLPNEDAASVEDHVSHCEACCETLLGLTSQDTFVGLLQQAQRASAELTLGLDCQGDQASPSLDIPAQLDEHPRYQIIGPIGRGGMGDVFKARHRMMERTVALKVINRDLVRRPEAVDRFHREVKTAARLSHPNIVTAHDADHVGDVHFLVMEFVDGVNLDEVIRQRGPLLVDQACDFIRQAAAGLQHAHELGMVHRDIKPHNLMLTASGEVKILDFGLASFAREVAADEMEEQLEDRPMESGSDRQLTHIGTMMGTPDFISPEQAQDAHAADIRSDIYSLGCTFYMLLAGRAPFADRAVLEKITAHREQAPPPLSELRRDVPADVEAVLLKMLAKDPAERYQQPRAVVDALTQALGSAAQPHAWGRGSRRKRSRLVALALGGLAALLAGVITLATNHGTLEIRTEVDDVDVVVTQGGEEIELKDLATGTIVKRLASGQWDIKLQGDRNDVQLDKSKFTLSRLGKAVVTITRKAPGDSLQAAPPGLAPREMSPAGRLAGHTDEIRDLAFFADDTRLATSSADKTFRIWDVSARKQIFQHDCPHYVCSLAVSPDGKVAALGFVTGTRVAELEILNLETKQRLHLLSGPPNRVERLAFSSNGKRLLSAGTEGWGTMWNVETGEKLYEFRQDKNRLWDATFSPDGSRLLTASSGQPQIVLRDAADGKQIREFISPKRRSVVTARFSRDGQRIVAATAGNEIPIYETATGKRLQTFETPSGASDVRFWQGDKYVIASGKDNVLRIFDTQSGQLFAERSLKSSVANRLALSADETLLATGGGISKVFIADHLKDRLGVGPRDYDVQLWRLPESVWPHPTSGSSIVVKLTKGGRYIVNDRPAGDAVELMHHLKRLLEENAIREVFIDSPEQYGIEPVKQLAALIRQVGGARVRWPDWAERLPEIADSEPARENLPIEEIHRLEGNKHPVFRLAFLDDTRFVSVASTGEVHVWDGRQGQKIQTLAGHVQTAYEATAAPGAGMFATGDHGGRFLLWNYQLESTGKIEAPAIGATALALSPDGSLMLTVGGRDKVPRIWDTKTGEQLRTLEAKGELFMAAAFSRDGKRIVAGGHSTKITVWDASTGDLISSPHVGTEVHTLALSPDNRLVAVASHGAVVIVDLQSQSVTHRLQGHRAKVRTVTFLPDGRHIISGSEDKTWRVWSLAHSREVARVTGDTQHTQRLAVSTDGKLVAGGGGQFQDQASSATLNDGDYDIRVWKLPESLWPQAEKPAEELAEVLRYEGHTSEVLALGFTPDGSHLVSAGLGDEGVLVWNARNGRRVRSYQEHRRGIHTLKISPDGGRVVSAGKSDALHLWDLATGKRIQRFTGHTGFIECVGFAPDGERIVSGSSNWVRGTRGDVTVRAWNAKTGDQLWQMDSPKIGENGHVHAVMFHPDGKHVVAAVHGPEDGLLVLDAGTGKLERRFSGQHSSIKCAARSPDGRTIATGHEAVLVERRRWDDPANSVVRLWDLDSGKLLRTLVGHRAGLQSVDFSADGSRLLSCSGGQHLNDPVPAPAAENSIRVWDVATGKLVASQALIKHGQRAVFAPDGQHIASSCGASNEAPLVQLWRLPKSLTTARLAK